jgi:hypothetical protein
MALFAEARVLLCMCDNGAMQEVDFNNVDENWQILALTRTAASF